jgi:tetratricopeptide (TPR) repeat protein
MPSHTFTRTGYWQDSIETNIASATAARRGGETAEELHASDYETYAYLQTAQDKAAQGVLNSLPEIASRVNPKALIAGAAPPLAAYFALAAIPARYALERGDWHQAAQLTVRETAYPYTDAITWFARGLGSARLAQAKPAYESAEALHKLGEKLSQSGEKYWALQVQIQETEVRAWAMFAEGKKQEALEQMEAAAKLEDGTEKSAVTPGPLAPARELLGEMLLAANRPAPALTEFEATLKKEPGRFRALYGAARAAKLSGQPTVSRKYYRELVRVCEKGDRTGRVELAEARKAVSDKETRR